MRAASSEPRGLGSPLDTHLKGLVGTDILPIPSLPGPAGSKSVCTLQALPEEIQVEKDVVLATHASFRRQKHQVSEGVRRAADVDNWGEQRGGSQREKPRSGGTWTSLGREAGTV